MSLLLSKEQAEPMGDCEGGIFAVSVLVACLLAFGTVTPTVFAQSGPKTPDMIIHIYLDPDTENSALQAGTIDLNDWPLTKDWIDSWALMPSTISLRDYVENSVVQIDMNNQRWPTGSSSSKFYDPADNQSVKSAEFRKAIAHLVDRERVIRDVLKGQGFRADLPLSPFQSAYMDMNSYAASDLLYDYNRTKAEEILDAAGFTLNPDTGIRRDPIMGRDLLAIKFHIPQDDPNKRAMGEMLTAELISIGIPVTGAGFWFEPWSWMEDWNLHIEGYYLGAGPEVYYDSFSSFVYASPATPLFNLNFVGFCNHEFDDWASKVKYPATLEEARQAAIQCGRIFLENCPALPAWNPKATKAYRSYGSYHWEGVVNSLGYGIDNYWTFLNMHQVGNGNDSRIDWGFKSDIEQLNVIGTTWPWDRKVLGLIYESLMGRSPFSLEPTEFLMANNYKIDTWDNGNCSEATVITFNIRDNVKWHGDNASVTLDDVAFSFNLTYQCGVGVAWNYPLVTDLNSTRIINSTAVEIYYNRKSAWALYWAGQLPIVRKSIWENLPTGIPTLNYNPASQDVNGNNVTDILEDGTGPWTFVAYSQGNYITLKAYDKYYLDQTFVEERIKTMFHFDAGDVDSDGIVNILDLSYMARALGTDSVNYPQGKDWYQYNPDCDLNQDGKIDYLDLGRVGFNYGRIIG